MKNKLDQVDFDILALLSEDAQMPYTEVAKRAFVSAGTVHMRMKKMKEMNVIKGTTLSLDYTQMGWGLTVFIGIFLKRSLLYKEAIDALKKIPEVVKVHHITGKYDIFIKVHARDSDHYRDVYQDSILSIQGIKNTEAFISLEENLNRHIVFRPL
ncbi:MAG: Lrp/AsnC ligand binding domain-containing protein [Sediminicola sp.]|tara:strand:- start:60707 stop:61171 length:465 start_codon:yes stop_codon:yes gene_type:complete